MDVTLHASRRDVLRNVKLGGSGRSGVVVVKRPPIGGDAPAEQPQLTTQGGGGLLASRSLSRRRAP